MTVIDAAIQGVPELALHRKRTITEAYAKKHRHKVCERIKKLCTQLLFLVLISFQYMAYQIASSNSTCIVYLKHRYYMR